MGIITFNKIVNHIYPKRKSLLHCFDFPNYGDLPRKTYKILSPEAVDAMQDILQLHFVRKRDFARAYKNRMQELGEVVKTR